MSHIVMLGVGASLALAPVLIPNVFPSVFSARVAGDSTVSVTVTVTPCDVDFMTRPQKRVTTAGGNLAETLVIEIINPATSDTITTSTVNSGSDGVATTPTCPYTYFTEGSSYDIAIKGASHLRRIYPGKVFAGFPDVLVDVSSPELIAGDTDLPAGDNDIDYDDIKQMSINMYSTADMRNDLNRDGKVNSLDLAIMITNLGLVGQ